MPRGLYIHIPFCQKKCSYCDFYSLEKVSQLSNFIDLLCTEITLWAEKNTDKPSIDTIFFGGGTPSLLLPEQLEKIYTTIQKYFTIEPIVEWTLECNPGTVTLDSLKAYKQIGVNRVSFGVQSFHQNELDFLERIHSPEQAKQAVKDAQKAGFRSVSIDLMYALPNQTLDSWKSTVEQAIELETNHISAYSLIYEEGTPLYAQYQKGKVIPIDEDIDVDQYYFVNERLSKAGFQQYEVSNYTKPNGECKHNVKYWESEEYISFGPSAHGYYNGERYWNIRSLHSYTQKIESGVLPVSNSEILTKEQRCFEMAFLGLRSTGIDLQRFANEFSIRLEDILKSEIELWKNEKLIEFQNGIVRSTSLGYQLNDAISLKVIAKLEKYLGTDWVGIEPELPSESEYTPLQILQ